MNHEICSLPPLSGYFSLIIIVLHGEFQQLYREILAAFHHSGELTLIYLASENTDFCCTKHRSASSVVRSG